MERHLAMAQSAQAQEAAESGTNGHAAAPQTSTPAKRGKTGEKTL